MHAARIVYEVSIYCSTADKYDQIYLKSANNWALAHLSTQADLCDITLSLSILRAQSSEKFDWNWTSKNA